MNSRLLAVIVAGFLIGALGGAALLALSQGGQVQQPLMKTFFSPKFGMVQDKFGVGWMVLVNQG